MNGCFCSPTVFPTGHLQFRVWSSASCETVIHLTCILFSTHEKGVLVFILEKMWKSLVFKYIYGHVYDRDGKIKSKKQLSSGMYF